MATGKKPYIKLQCGVCKRINYYTRKSKKASDTKGLKLALKKYCKWCRKHTAHKEGKK
ncbi:MAG: 50S ribosomal protein L33 [bacterium]